MCRSAESSTLQRETAKLMYALLSFSNTNLMNKTKRVLDRADNTQLYSIHVKLRYRIVS